MRKFKKFAAMASAVVLAACAVAPLAMNVSAAATQNKITINVPENVGSNHVFEAYQIFKGDLESGSLKNIKWANETEANVKAFISALKGDSCPIKTECSGLGETATAAEVAELISTNVTEAEGNVKTFAAFLETQVGNFQKVTPTQGDANNVISIGSYGDGWYLIVDKVDGVTLDKPGSFSSYLLTNVDATTGTEIDFKGNAPTVVKKVKEDDKDVANNGDITKGYWVAEDGYNDVADYSIGESVPFRLEATLPASEYYVEYETYYLKFTDTLGKGFDAPTSIEVKWGTGENDKVTLSSENQWKDTDKGINASVTTDASSKETTITVEIADVKDTDLGELKGGGTVTVDYNATLNVSAEIGRPGNYNDVDLTYFNNPKNSGEGGSKTTTEKDGVVVFTYGFDVHKYDGADEEEKTTKWLAGAVFAVKNAEGEYMCETTDPTTGKTTITWAKPADSNGYPDNLKTWTSDESANIVINGLDDGEYELVEKEKPAGYTAVAPIPFKIVATTENNQNQTSICQVGDAVAVRDGKAQLKALQIQMKKQDNSGWDTEKPLTATLKDGETVNTNAVMFVVNNSGAELPGTGGIGTTIFYIGGGAMVAVAGVFLITKKRMSKKEN